LPIIASEGDNRSGKTLTISFLGWIAHNQGIKVYCACPRGYDGKMQHIINYPHIDIDPALIHQSDLYDCVLLEDEFDQLADSHMNWDSKIRLHRYFNFQAKKRGVYWCWTAVEHKNIDRTIRHNPDYIIENHRIPRDWTKPLIAIKWKVWNRFSNNPKVIYFKEPWKFFPIYNHRQGIPPPEIQISKPSNAELFKQVIG